MAAVELHETIGPARTTISDVAKRAGVQRLTVYRHFPDEHALLAACSGLWISDHPPPNIACFAAIPDPRERLRRALEDLYDYYLEGEAMIAMSYRDATELEFVADLVAGLESGLDGAVEILLKGWNARGRKRHLMRAAIRHALDFDTWRSLRDQGLVAEDQIELLERMVPASS